jgi:hypothetical protein
MLVQCMREMTVFEAHEIPYPGEGRQTKFYSAAGDRYIECPTCRRRYFFHDGTGKWSCDRDLNIIS